MLKIVCKTILYYVHLERTNILLEYIMETIAVSDLRANLMKILKEIEHGAIINITSRGKVVAKLIPPEHSKEIAKNKLKAISKTAVINDVISPIDVQWKVIE